MGTPSAPEGFRWEGTASYRAGSGGVLRPYLWLLVTGPHGDSSLPINGLIDTGADMSVLPLPYATMLGYNAAELEYTTIDQVEGSADAWVPTIPSSASVFGGPVDTFELRPVFINALDALWGRNDFLTAFQLELNEPLKKFTIRRY